MALWEPQMVPSSRCEAATSTGQFIGFGLDYSTNRKFSTEPWDMLVNIRFFKIGTLATSTPQCFHDRHGLES